LRCKIQDYFFVLGGSPKLERIGVRKVINEENNPVGAKVTIEKIVSGRREINDRTVN